MDQRKHAACTKGAAQHGPQDTCIRQRPTFTRQCGDQTAIGLGVINPDTDTVGPDIKAETVRPFDWLKGRDVKNLGRVQMVVRLYLAQVRVVAQIAVAVSKGVGHLGNHRDQRAGPGGGARYWNPRRSPGSARPRFGGAAES